MDDKTRALLNRILSEPGFRAYLQNDPVGALADAGIALDPNYVLNLPISLPSDEEIQSILVLDPNWDHIQGCMSVIGVVGWQSH